MGHILQTKPLWNTKFKKVNSKMYIICSFFFCTNLILYGTAIEYAKIGMTYIVKTKFLSRGEFITSYTVNYL